MKEGGYGCPVGETDLRVLSRIPLRATVSHQEMDCHEGLNVLKINEPVTHSYHYMSSDQTVEGAFADLIDLQ